LFGYSIVILEPVSFPSLLSVNPANGNLLC
jgi:hypothetical protein